MRSGQTGKLRQLGLLLEVAPAQLDCGGRNGQFRTLRTCGVARRDKRRCHRIRNREDRKEWGSAEEVICVKRDAIKAETGTRRLIAQQRDSVFNIACVERKVVSEYLAHAESVERRPRSELSQTKRAVLRRQGM